ncbi:unnamed protein product [Prorocentrum cordatum]|nr:unnamed protein product [Polarella glacialis]
MVHYTWFLCLKPALLAETGRYGTLDVPQDDSVASFLHRYGFHEDIEGLDVPLQPVFFPLFCAACEGNMAIVRSLVESRAEVPRRLLQVGVSVLEAVCLCGHAEICAYLLDHGAELNSASQLDGMSAVHKAASGGSPSVLRILLDRRADINARMLDSRTPLMCAANAGNCDCVTLLLEEGADCAATDDKGYTAKVLAAIVREHGVLACMKGKADCDSVTHEV